MHRSITNSSTTPDNVTAVRALAEICESTEGISLDFGWDSIPEDDTVSLWLCRQDSELVGAGLVFRIGGSVETVLIVHPAQRRKGTGSELLSSIYRDCQNRGERLLYLVTDRRSKSGKSFIGNNGASLSRSEYRMMSTGCRLPDFGDAHVFPDVTLTEATEQDIEFLVDNWAKCFDMLDEDREARYDLTRRRLSNQRCTVYFITAREGVVGQLVLSFEAVNPYIYGLCVLPQYQGHGYGSAALNEALKLAALRTNSHVCLEVETKNENALKVYTRVGFHTIATFDYYLYFNSSAHS